MRIKLVRKFANVINGIDLTKVRVGDVLDMKARDALILIAEGWAEPITPVRISRSPSNQNTEPAGSVG